MKLTDAGVYRVALSTGMNAEFPKLKSALLYIWDNLDSVTRVVFNGKVVSVGDYLWKK